MVYSTKWNPMNFNEILGTPLQNVDKSTRILRGAFLQVLWNVRKAHEILRGSPCKIYREATEILSPHPPLQIVWHLEKSLEILRTPFAKCENPLKS